MNNKIDNLYDLPVPKDCRGFFDPIKTREWINEYTLDSLKHALNKIESASYKLKVNDISFVDPEKKFSYKDQKKAIMDRMDLTLPVKGTFQLIDKHTGNVLDEKRTTIAHIPYITDRNTIILNGTEYILTNQQRLKPGIYARVKESGEVEAHVNVQAGSGVGGKVIFHSDRALFVYQVGTTQIPLYGMLHDLGMPDSKMEEAWGTEVFLKNKANYSGTEIDKLYNKVFKYDKQ